MDRECASLVDREDPAFIVARALAHWGNKPDPKNAEERMAASYVYLSVIEKCCACWGLAIVHIGVLKEIESEHQE